MADVSQKLTTEMIESLQRKESQLWDSINAEVGSSTIDLISELIEVNLKLEKLSNQ